MPTILKKAIDFPSSLKHLVIPAMEIVETNKIQNQRMFLFKSFFNNLLNIELPPKDFIN